MQCKPSHVVLCVLAAAVGAAIAVPAQTAFADADSPIPLLMGIQYSDFNSETHPGVSAHDVPSFPLLADYLTHAPEDVVTASCVCLSPTPEAVFRYRGDENGLSQLGAIVDACLDSHVQVVLAPSLPRSDVPGRCRFITLLGQRLRGRLAIWSLPVGTSPDTPETLAELCAALRQTDIRSHNALRLPARLCQFDEAGRLPGELQSTLEACMANCDSVFVESDSWSDGNVDKLRQACDSLRALLEDMGLPNTRIGCVAVPWDVAGERVDSGGRTLAARTNMLLAGLLCSNVDLFLFGQAPTARAPATFRKFEDWSNEWPNASKVSGTRIINAGLGENGWGPDPHYGAWEVFAFWAQCAPPGSSAFRLPVSVSGAQRPVAAIATYQAGRDEIIVLVQTEDTNALALEVGVSDVAWNKVQAVTAEGLCELIDLGSGEHRAQWEDSDLQANIEVLSVFLTLPEATGFTRVRIRRAASLWDAEVLDAACPERIERGSSTWGNLTIRNTGRGAWYHQRVNLAPLTNKELRKNLGVTATLCPLTKKTPPGFVASFVTSLQTGTALGRVEWPFRLTTFDQGMFGPIARFATHVVDSRRPRKIVAHPAKNHIHIQWFPPECDAPPVRYEVQRSHSFCGPFATIADATETNHLDFEVDPGRTYFYQVVAVFPEDERSRASDIDSAAAQATPRPYHADIVAHTVPGTMIVGETCETEVTFENTGRQAWQIGSTCWLQATQLWTFRDTGLPRITSADKSLVEPGECVTFRFAFAGSKPGRFENHWVLCTGPVEGNPSGEPAFFGTPLLAETAVLPK